MNAIQTDFSYDPFDAQVMANPLPYYRVLRDEYPLYYLPQWDTFALARFADIWRVLEVNDESSSCGHRCRVDHQNPCRRGESGRDMARLGFRMITLAAESPALRRGAADYLREATAP
ncbi:hypothetical protein BST12_21650 [Mycobacterium angelicum]|uniref:Cytochrome n=1 Tax=Mycobacterium angelicum TaxID=470074 RepID=A0A1W9ZIK2_MYCAN|nr:hypothetical protein BST12_21650 [Mycobacterium angelicum]